MSKTLTSQDLNDLQEMPGSLEMGELRKMTTLENISLAEGAGVLPLSNERKLKTNSLKRFFGLSPKTKAAANSFESEKCECDSKDAQGQQDLDGSFSKASLKSSLSSYWGTVFKFRKSGKPNSKIEIEAASTLSTENSRPEAYVTNIQDNVCYPKDKCGLDEIHTLQISKECSQK